MNNSLSRKKREIMLLRDLIESIENGSRPKGGVGRIESGIPSIGGEHINNQGGFDFSEMKFVPKPFYAALKRGKIKFQDVLLVKDGATTGKTAIVREDFPYADAAVNEHIFILRTNRKKVLPDFLFFYLFSPFGQEQIGRNFHGAAIGGINSTFLDDFWIPVPSLETQTNMVAFLRKSHELEQKRERANHITEEFLQSAFVRMFGDPATNPKQWKTELLGSLLANRLAHGKSLERAKVSKSPCGVPVLKLSALTDYGFDSSQIKYYNDSSPDLSAWYLKKDDILVSRSNTFDLVGRVGRYTGQPYPCIFPDLMIRVQPDHRIVEPRYFEFYLRTAFVKKFFQERARGTSGSMPKISNRDIQEVEVRVPPIELQKSFTSIATKVEILNQVQTQSTRTIHRLFTNLMSVAFRRDLNVKADTNMKANGAEEEQIV